MRANRFHLVFFALTLGVIVPGARANDSLRVYYIGNSLTRNVPLERLQKLFESQGITYDYGMQLGGGHARPADGSSGQVSAACKELHGAQNRTVTVLEPRACKDDLTRLSSEN